MFKEFNKELQRQRGFQTEATTAFNQRLPGAGAETAQTQMAAGQADREKTYGQLAQQPISVGHSMFAPNAVDQASAGMRGTARAKLGSYGDWQHQQGLANTRFQDELNRVSNFSQGWQQVEPYRMNDAQHSHDELAFWGQLISSLGGSSMNIGQAFNMNPAGTGGGAGAMSNYNYGQNQMDVDPNYMAALGGYV